MSLPWKHAAKLYRNKYRIKSRKCDRQREEITRLHKSSTSRRLRMRGLTEQISKGKAYIAELTIKIGKDRAYIAELEHLIETGTERD